MSGVRQRIARVLAVEGVPCGDALDRFRHARGVAVAAADAGLAMERCVEVALVAAEMVDELLQGGGGTLHVLAERGAIELCCVGRGERHTTSRITWSARWWGARQTATLQRGGGVIFYARFEV